MSEHNYEPLWFEALKQIENEYTSQNKTNEFKLWFNLDYIEDENNTIFVAAASEFMWQRMVSMGNVEIIKNKIKELSGIEDIEIKCNIKNTKISSSPVTSDEEIRNFEKSKESIIPSFESENQNTEELKHPLLDPRFTFDTFVPGASNNYAYNAGLSAAKNPGETYNPILFYGGSGLGKTHLMEAIGNYIYTESKGKAKVAYISAEAFTNEFTFALKNSTPKNNAIDKFKSKYRNIDVLLLDDIHFLDDKEGVQEEVFYTFEALRNKRAQMVFTCDRPLNEVKGISNRLRTRFSNGLNVDLKLPDYETRKAILLKKLEILNKKIPEEVIDYIAKTIETNIRDLESALTKMIGYSEFIGNALTIEIAKDLLKDIVNQPLSANISIDTIQKVVSDYYNISVSDIKGKKRDHKYVFPRKVAMYIAREITEDSLPEIGSEFGGRDHTTVMYAINNIGNQIKSDSTLETTIKILVRSIKEYRK